MTTERSDSIKELAAALVKAQGAIQPAIKDKTNPAFRSRYADLSAVWDACRDALTQNGLSVVQMPVDADTGRVALTTMLLHTSGEFISSTVSTQLVKSDPQGVGSALTYLRRYALSAMVGVVADEDDDGNAASNQTAQRGGATFTPPAQSNGHGKPSRAGLIKRILELEAQFEKNGGKNERNDLDTYSDERLIEMGQKLKAHLDTQKASASNS